MTDQLVLIEVTNTNADVNHPWQLSSAFCEIGLQGVLMARQALKRARNGYIDISENYIEVHGNIQNSASVCADETIRHDHQAAAYTGAAA